MPPTGSPVGPMTIDTPRGVSARMRAAAGPMAPSSSRIAASMKPDTTIVKTLASNECAPARIRMAGRQIVVPAVPRIARRPHRWIRRDVNLLALGHQGEAGERVGVLAADQDADATQPRLAHTQTGAVAIGPRELLPERRHELAVVIEHAAVVADEHVGVPEAPDALLRPLVESEGDEDAGPARRRGDALELRPRAAHGVGGESPEPAVVVDGRGQRRPDRKRGNIRLREGDELGAVTGGLVDEALRLGHGLLEIEEDRRDVCRRHATRGIRRGHHAPAFGQLVLIQFTVAEGSLWPLPGRGQLGGAVIDATGIVMMRSGSHTGNG